MGEANMEDNLLQTGRTALAALTILYATFLSATASAAGSAPVTIINPPNNPAPTTNVDEPGRVPFQFSISSSFLCSNNGVPMCQVTLPAIPSGHRLVIQHVSGLISFLSVGSNPVLIQVAVNSLMFSSFFTQVVVSSSAFDQPVLGYVDAGDTATLVAREIGTSISMGGSFSVSGYLLDCTVSPCNTIAP